ncbi:myc proto-oncogene protein isoform X2 [Procambarus clarkii]|uniref:myc proto-oncogene protein isoform X2 n=1 Tax=Procambarus clarkii TaxID=6728 RepID=UPI003742390C
MEITPTSAWLTPSELELVGLTSASWLIPTALSSLELTPAEVTPVWLTPSGLALPELTPSGLALPELTPSGLALPELTPSGLALPELTPSGLALPELTPSGLALPELTPSWLALPELTPSGLALPELTPSGLALPELTPSGLALPELTPSWLTLLEVTPPELSSAWLTPHELTPSRLTPPEQTPAWLTPPKCSPSGSTPPKCSPSGSTPPELTLAWLTPPEPTPPEPTPPAGVEPLQDGLWLEPNEMLQLDPDAEWSEEGPTLSSNIWNKFEMLLTPPRSPLRETDLNMIFMDLDIESYLMSLDLPAMEDDHLNIDLEAIDPVESGLHGLPCTHGLGRGTCTSCTQLALAGSELRHDCMWVGTCTAEAHIHSHRHPRTHNDSGSQIRELLMDSSSAVGFTNIADLHPVDDVKDTHMHDDEGASLQFTNHHIARPDTPSESSETDTDEDNDPYDDDEDDEHGNDDFDVSREEEVYTSDEPPSAVHVDHSYHCLRIPSPTPPSPPPMSFDHYSRPSLPHTPSDTDEIDVVSVGSPDSAYSSSSSRSTSKRHGTTTFITTTTGGGTDLKRIVKVRTGTLPVKPSKRTRKQLQQVVAAGVKRRPNGALNEVVLLRKASVSSSSLKSPKRLQRNHDNTKRKSHKSDNDAPEKRQMHNSLERMRRVDLRNAFEDLRLLVPDLHDRDKSPKVEILKKASHYCHAMTTKERALAQEKDKQKRYQSELRKRLLILERERQQRK